METPFLDGNRIGQLIQGLSSGTEFVAHVLQDMDCPAAVAGVAKLEEMAAELAQLLGTNPAVLNQDHPKFETICRNLHAAIKEASAPQASGPALVS